MDSDRVLKSSTFSHWRDKFFEKRKKRMWDYICLFLTKGNRVSSKIKGINLFSQIDFFR